MFGKSARTMFGRKAKAAKAARARNPTRKAQGTGMKARTRMARAANKAGIGLKPVYTNPGVYAPSQKSKLQKKVAATDKAKARAKAVKAGKTVKGTNWKKRKQARQARKGKI